MATHSGVLETEDDFLNARVRAECEPLIPKTVEITHEDCVDVFLSLTKGTLHPTTIYLLNLFLFHLGLEFFFSSPQSCFHGGYSTFINSFDTTKITELLAPGKK